MDEFIISGYRMIRYDRIRSDPVKRVDLSRALWLNHGRVLVLEYPPEQKHTVGAFPFRLRCSSTVRVPYQPHGNGIELVDNTFDTGREIPALLTGGSRHERKGKTTVAWLTCVQWFQ